MDSVKEFPLLNPALFASIKTAIDEDKQAFTASRVYDVEKEELLIAPDLRQSKFKTISTPEIFSLVDNYLQEMTKLDKWSDYVLVKNNVTVVKYEEGDFFDAHEDFLSFKSNVFQEFTWILCLDGNCDGGETMIYVNDFFKHASSNSKTTGCSLVFRKDLKHAGEIIRSGHKYIMTCNVNVFSKSCTSILVVSFKDYDEKYVLPEINILKHETQLKVQLECLNFKYKNTNNPLDMKYKFIQFDMFSPEQFSIIYKIIMDEYVTFDEFYANKDILDYFCIETKNILFNTHKSGEIKSFDKISFEEPIILLHNSETAEYVKQIINETNLPYVSFKLVFAEGMNSFGGGLSDVEPVSYADFVWLSCDDNCVLFYHSMDRTSVEPMSVNVKDYLTHDTNKTIKANYFDDCIVKDYVNKERKTMEFSINDDELISFYNEDDYDDNDDDYDNFFGAINENGARNIPISCDSMYNTIHFFNFEYSIPTISNKEIIELIADEEAYHDFTPYTFKKTNANKMILMEKVKETMNKLKFFDYVKTNINSLRMHLPQIKENIAKTFCNEDVYVKSTMIVIDGFIKIE